MAKNHKHWDEMTMAERQQRLGDPSIDRVADGYALDVACARRLLRGEPLSRDARKRALRVIRAAADAGAEIRGA